jgi:NADPH:quinone reductase-like Zn-dependent oxidoreductase
MKAYEIGTQQGLASLRMVERSDPVAGPGDVVLKVRATCLNHRDLLVLEGGYGPRRPENRTPCSDGVGEVTALGAGVTGIAIGDRATANHFVTWTGGAFAQSAFGADLGINRDGWLAERIVIPAAALVRVPDTIDDAQAAPLPAAGLTAWNALVEVGKIKAGDVVLALGTGGVSIFALQIARMHGARVAVTSSSDEKLAMARELGAEITINYRTDPDWPAALLAATGGAGADIVVETGGLATLPQSIAAAAVNGRIVIIGALAGPPSQGLPNFPSIIGKNLTLRGIAEGSRAMLAAMVRAIEVSAMRPVIDREFAFERAADAYAHLKSGEHLGKVMIRL